MKVIYVFFDKLEDKIRGRLSHYPILYAFIGGVGIVAFWRGVWHTGDYFAAVISYFHQNSTIDLASLPWWDGPLSIIVGSILLLSTGLFVFDFIGTESIISGMKGEKKIAEKTETELRTETGMIGEIKKEVSNISRRLDDIAKELEKK